MRIKLGILIQTFNRSLTGSLYSWNGHSKILACAIRQNYLTPFNVFSP